jgi:hypothetical protein
MVADIFHHYGIQALWEKLLLFINRQYPKEKNLIITSYQLG